MNRVTLILTFLFSLMFSSPSYSEWTKVDEGTGSSNRGINFYVDFDRIRKVDGYVYYWVLTDYLKPTETGHLSSKIYFQGDCKLFRIKFLSVSHHKEPMGEGTGDSYSPENPEWDYPYPDSVMETILKTVCSW